MAAHTTDSPLLSSPSPNALPERKRHRTCHVGGSVSASGPVSHRERSREKTRLAAHAHTPINEKVSLRLSAASRRPQRATGAKLSSHQSTVEWSPSSSARSAEREPESESDVACRLKTAERGFSARWLELGADEQQRDGVLGLVQEDSDSAAIVTKLTECV